MSAISWVSAIQGCPLRGVPLYMFSSGCRHIHTNPLLLLLMKACIMSQSSMTPATWEEEEENTSDSKVPHVANSHFFVVVFLFFFGGGLRHNLTSVYNYYNDAKGMASIQMAKTLLILMHIHLPMRMHTEACTLSSGMCSFLISSPAQSPPSLNQPALEEVCVHVLRVSCVSPHWRCGFKINVQAHTIPEMTSSVLPPCPVKNFGMDDSQMSWSQWVVGMKCSCW